MLYSSISTAEVSFAEAELPDEAQAEIEESIVLLEQLKYEKKPLYDRDELALIVASHYKPATPREIAIKRSVSQWVSKNIKYFTLEEMSQILGIHRDVLSLLVPKGAKKLANARKSQGLVIWRSPELASKDQEAWDNLKI